MNKSQLDRKTADSVFCFAALQELMGSLHDGSQETVTLYQDDATRDTGITVGRKHFYGDTLVEAITKAITHFRSQQPDPTLVDITPPQP